MEVRCEIKLYDYDTKTGNYLKSKEAVIRTDITTSSAKQMFDEIMDTTDDKNNKFYIMEIVMTEDGDPEPMINFYEIRTNIFGNIDSIINISPNTLDEDMLIDAIVGCRPTHRFMESCNDRIISKVIIDMEDNNGYNYYTWSDDAKDRLQKVNTLRLREIYKKLKS